MDSLSQFALAAGLGWASGLRLYAICFVLGILGYFDYVELPGQLQVLEHRVLLIGLGICCVGEFLADKIPAFDSIWDALHTFVRGPGAAVLAALALDGDSNRAMQVLLALFAGGLATATHLGKAGTRVAINHSPEPFSNFVMSATEDVGSLGILWLAWQHPAIFCLALFLFLLLLCWALPKLWNLIRSLITSWRSLGARNKTHRTQS